MPPQPALISGRVMETSWTFFTCVRAYKEPPEAYPAACPCQTEGCVVLEAKPSLLKNWFMSLFTSAETAGATVISAVHNMKSGLILVLPCMFFSVHLQNGIHPGHKTGGVGGPLQKR